MYNFFPAKRLEDLLELLDRLRGKIRDITDAVGKEFEILEPGETLDPRDILERVAKEDSSVIDDLEEAEDISLISLREALRLRLRRLLEENPGIRARVLALVQEAPVIAGIAEEGVVWPLFTFEIGKRSELILYDLDTKSLVEDDLAIVRAMDSARIGLASAPISDESVMEAAKDLLLERVRTRFFVAGRFVSKAVRLASERLRRTYFKVSVYDEPLAKRVAKARQRLQQVRMSAVIERDLEDLLRRTRSSSDTDFLREIEEFVAPLPLAMADEEELGAVREPQLVAALVSGIPRQI